MKTQYWIAQYIEDMFRQECRNVGVIISDGVNFSGKFLGESENKIDRRRFKGIKHSEAYEEWFLYWNDQINEGNMNAILENSQNNFRVINGGYLSDVNSDPLEDVTEYLYSLLVSSGGFAEAMNNEIQNEMMKVALNNDLKKSFQEKSLFDQNQFKYPIKVNQKLKGSVEFQPSYIQENGSLYVIEWVDFTQRVKKYAHYSAGNNAFMYRDLKAKFEDITPITVVKFLQSDIENEDVDIGLQILKNESKVVNWLDENERIIFLDERLKIAAG